MLNYVMYLYLTRFLMLLVSFILQILYVLKKVAFYRKEKKKHFQINNIQYTTYNFRLQQCPVK